MQTNREHGFTLLELLVVVVIVAILFTYTTLAIRSDSADELIEKEARRLEHRIQLALEEAVLRGEDYAIEVNLDAYRFLHFTGTSWEPLADDRIFREYDLPENMELELSLEETDVVIDISDQSAADTESDTEETSGDATNDQETGPKPQIFLLSSGEITPEFDIRFYILGVETSYFVQGFFDGSLKTEISDL